ncbi:MAG TPA: methyltransferase [Mucilaginibacter sp.]|jgi:tRNA1Val (adenine37-N6)-methyltransferase
MFRFKQFTVDQSGCAMKINTDGVLLGAMTTADKAANILDIGTGTGVIAMMLAQRFADTKIDAVEIDEVAAATTERNFKGSPFADRLSVYAMSFESYFDQFPERKYNLIVSNPPFYVDSLKSPRAKKALAKHTDVDFFEKLIKSVSAHLTLDGSFWLILPVNIGETLIELAAAYFIYPQEIINIQSYPHSLVHRVVLCFGFEKVSVQTGNLTIYKSVGIYSDEYQHLLQPYFLAF